MLNEIDALATFEEEVTLGNIQQYGNYSTREWSFLLTEFVKNATYWNEITPRNDLGQMQFHSKGWIPTWAWEYEFN